MAKTLSLLSILSLILTFVVGVEFFELDGKCELQWYYNAGSGYYSIRLRMPNHYYVAFSYGGTHINSDMIVFKADGTASMFYDMYSYGYNEPVKDFTNNYSGSASYTQSTDSVYFQYTRYLNTYDVLDYVMDLNQPIRMGYAIREYDNDKIKDQTSWENNFGEHNRVGYFNLILWSNGTTTYDSFQSASNLSCTVISCALIIMAGLF